MQAIGFYLLLPLLYFISLLPFFVLYFFSDVLFIFIFYIFRYRRTVVSQNLRKSFPEKTDEELHVIQKKYYHHLCDLVVESVKALTISERAIVKRCYFASGSMEIFKHYFKERKNCIALMGHYGNWEWAGLSMSNQSPYLLQVIYRPLRNQYFDRMMNYLRSRFDALPVAMESVARQMLKKNSSLACTVFIADQTPSPDSSHRVNFLNQETPFFQGAEKLARKFQYPVVYAVLKKRMRGYYEIFIEVLTDDASKMNENALTEMFAQRLEKDILEEPSYWLWSHRRWKHAKKV